MEHDFAFEVESLQFDLSCATNMVDAVHTSMESGPYAPDEYIDALYGAHAYLKALNVRLKDCVQREFAGRKRAKQIPTMSTAQEAGVA